MPNRSRVTEDFPVVSTWESLVAEEVDGLVVDSRSALARVGFCLDVLQAIGLVPAMREHVE